MNEVVRAPHSRGAAGTAAAGWLSGRLYRVVRGGDSGNPTADVSVSLPAASGAGLKTDTTGQYPTKHTHRAGLATLRLIHDTRHTPNAGRAVVIIHASDTTTLITDISSETPTLLSSLNTSPPSFQHTSTTNSQEPSTLPPPAMDVQTPYALDLSSLLFTAFTLGFTPLLLVGLLFRMAVHPITLLYEWLTDQSRRYSPTLRAQSLRSSSGGGGTYAGPAFTAPPALRGTGTYLNISYSPGLGASVSVGSGSGGGQPAVFGVGLADKSSKYQPTLRHLPPRSAVAQPYRPETISSIAGAQAHASAQPLALDRAFRQIEEDKWDRTERWRREIMEDDY
ncbi:hypothetical protein A1Q1_01563 [Trichosporon asahii var. asahii CBS 2479]|uniref:Uncharacterized protein n=1 Tax=Trichosporon asahii var. asahii (strain ATCC 90039 / CBS 2479 / JCM 2466 / KCTC 7840 / NBRC 103889/ NCYC 2677 / UAMH 7654) TaxID=1186058 RepID=J5T609_TRIAS|nr:hypothetical protein A1Q1_01563 [Trichosporon asahii var. asahii CBS 2479]EJT49361.1 hypothetical protein A1Q1_01563 [Trichosporon asahii var. asahii CBS 2479]